MIIDILLIFFISLFLFLSKILLSTLHPPDGLTARWLIMTNNTYIFGKVSKAKGGLNFTINIVDRTAPPSFTLYYIIHLSVTVSAIRQGNDVIKFIFTKLPFNSWFITSKCTTKVYFNNQILTKKIPYFILKWHIRIKEQFQNIAGLFKISNIHLGRTPCCFGISRATLTTVTTPKQSITRKMIG